jgi:hypothetical protein
MGKNNYTHPIITPEEKQPSGLVRTVKEHRLGLWGTVGVIAVGVTGVLLSSTNTYDNTPAQNRRQPGEIRQGVPEAAPAQPMRPYGVIEMQQPKMPVFGFQKDGIEFRVLEAQEKGKVEGMQLSLSMAGRISLERYAPVTIFAPELGLVSKLDVTDFAFNGMQTKHNPPLDTSTINFYLLGTDYHGINPNLMPKVPQPPAPHSPRQRMPGFPELDPQINPSMPPIQSDPVLLLHYRWTAPEK